MFRVKDGHPYIPSIDLYLDAKKKQSFGFVSHAHSDHAAQHRRILCSKPTAALLTARLKKVNVWTHLYDMPVDYQDSRITLYPAGHILGSAQILIENAQGRLLYTGDFRTRPSLTAEKFRQVPCDTVIMESTFGLPHYRFPPREEVLDHLLSVINQKLEQGITPVVFVYPLGKGQELLYSLSRAGIPLAVDQSIARLARIYEKFGVTFGKYDKFRRSEARSKVLLLPTAHRMQRFITELPERYLIYMSGWGMDRSAKFRLRVDEVMPFSDHADFNELVEFAENSSAKEIFCTHGFEQFASILRRSGLNARTLMQPPQLNLFET